MYRAVTREIAVEVEPFFLADQSDPQAGRYVWAYRVTIANGSEVPVRLLSRYWHVTDANGRVEEVRGPGVVGETPRLAPGDSFQYTSGCPLPTPSGIMRGSYTMERRDGEDGDDGKRECFEVAIPAFSLDMPTGPRSVN